MHAKKAFKDPTTGPSVFLNDSPPSIPREIKCFPYPVFLGCRFKTDVLVQAILHQVALQVHAARRQTLPTLIPIMDRAQAKTMNQTSAWTITPNHAADTALNDSTNDWLAASDYDYQHDGHLEQPSTFSFNDNPRAGREGTLHFYQDDNAYYEEDMQGQQGAQDGYTSGYDDQHASHYDHHNFDSHLHQSPSFGFEADYQAGWEKILNLDEGDNVCYEGNMESQQGCFQDEYVSGYDDHHGGNCSDNAYYDDGSYDDGSYDDGSYDDGSYDDGSYDDGYFSDGY
ncbi:hypothetical protein N0V82_010323 [Gnomoniopsis sp. IMI 355080]|nr:hypothetical protein N0V82_010323 [Gnomoniopsis sp. IMI 355080]